MKKINLEEIFDSYSELDIDHCYTKESIILAMKVACKQTLELAAENAKCEHVRYGEYTNGRYITNEGFIEFPEFGDNDSHEIFIDKQSILDTINNVK